MSEFQRCTRCVMDNSSDPRITFDENGHCNYCTDALERLPKTYFPNKKGARFIENKLQSIKKNSADKKYDCVMGLSGGLDSSYLAMLGKKWDLRVLAVHIDDGFDTDISKHNIEKLVEATGFDYEVIKPHEEQFHDLLKSYIRAAVPGIDNPQDNVLFAFLYKKIKQYNIKYFLSGGNFALESILQKGNAHDALDVINLKDIHNKFGEMPIDNLELLSSLQKGIDQYFLRLESPRLLNYLDYNRERAFKELYDFCEFEYYGSKHLENDYTAFVQLYWLPKKFNLDKRTSHLSSMIVSGQMTRDEALEELRHKPMSDTELEQLASRVINKIGMSQKEFISIMNGPNHDHSDYAVQDSRPVYKIAKTIHTRLKK